MGDDADRLGGEVISGPQGHQFGPQVLRGQHVERGERFVHQQQVGLKNQRAGEPNALPHAAGKLFGISGFEAVQADHVDRVERTFPALRGRDPSGGKSEFDIVLNGQPWHQRKGLKYQRRPRVGAVEFGAAVAHGAAGRRDEPGDDPEQRGFTRSGSAQQGNDFTGAQLQIDGVEDTQFVTGGAGKALADRVDIDEDFRVGDGRGRCRHEGCSWFW